MRLGDYTKTVIVTGRIIVRESLIIFDGGYWPQILRVDIIRLVVLRGTKELHVDKGLDLSF